MGRSRELEAMKCAGGTWEKGQDMDTLRCRCMDAIDWQLGRGKASPFTKLW